MTSKGKRPLRHLTASDKIEAIQRIHDGESKASVARDIGVPESTLRGWCKNEDKLRFMSRQSGPDKLGADQLADKIVDGAAAAAAAVSLLAGPPEKRAKLDTSGLPLNFSNKIKYDDLAYKRGSLNGLDFSTGKSLSDLSFNGLGTDYSSFGKADLTALNGSCKPKGYGADLSKQNDPSKSDLSMAAISPLTSLSHLSGMTSLAQSPLALSFNEIATNLNLIAQLNNPTLAAMTGLNGLNHSNSAMRNIKPKPPSHSPRNDGDKPQGLSVKNWAKCQQKSSNDSYGLNLSDCKSKLKASPMSSAQPLGRDAPVDDALWYWLKSQQTMLGLNNLYTAMPSAPSPIRSSTPQQQQIPQHNHTIPTPPIASTPQTPSSTPSGSSDDTKNSSWFWQWYKTFGASLMSEKRSSTPQQHSLSMNNNHVNNNNNSIDSKPSHYENILYSQLTKDAMAGSDNLNNNNEIHNSNALNKPEDLSAKPVNRGVIKEEKEHIKHESDEANSHAKDVLDNLLYKNSVTNNNNDRVNNNNDISQNNNLPNSHNSHSANESMNSPNNDENSNHNNSHHDDIDVKSEFSDSVDISGPVEALEHGEKFLKWLESYSDPRVTAMQVMQFRYLLDGIRSSAKQNSQCANDRTRIRKRK